MPRKKANALPRPEPEMFTIFADILQETEATDEHDGAILVNCGDSKEVWLPISELSYNGERGDEYVEITLPDWLAKKNGLVDGQGELVEVTTEEAKGLESMPEPEPFFFTFKAAVEKVYDSKYVLVATNDKGDTATLEFDKDSVFYEGRDIAELEEGYDGIEITVAWHLAEEKHLPEFLGIVATPLATEATPEEQQANQQQPGTERVTAYVELTDAEKVARGKDLVAALEKKAGHKDSASYYNGLAREEEKKIEKIMDVLKAGSEERTVTCKKVPDYEANEVVYVEIAEPHREIKRRAMTEKDRQLTLFDAPAEPAQQEEPKEPDTVNVNGRVVGITEDTVTVAIADDEGAEIEFEIYRSDINLEDGDWKIGDEIEFAMLTDRAIAEGIIDEPEDNEAEAATDIPPEAIEAPVAEVVQ